jgi:sulfate transport system permease protein
LALGFTLSYLALIVLIPLAGVFIKSSSLGWTPIVSIATDPRTLSALEVSFLSAFAAALINTPFGFLIAWVLTRYDFPGRRIVDAAVDLPFALPTAVAGITLATLYGPNGDLGAALGAIGVKVAYAPTGIVVALIFVGLPFVVRTVQPVIVELDREVEDAAATLGAGRAQTFRRVIFPILLPSVLTGFALAFARGVGEYGSVIFIAGNIPFSSEIAPLLIVIRLEEFDYAAATTIAAIMLMVSFLMLSLINLAQSWSRRRIGDAT